MTDTAVAQELHALRQAVHTLTRMIGPRLTREQLCVRRGVSRSTLARQIERGEVPRPGTDGKWMLSEVLEWEDMERAQRAVA